jgi:hypothetical protein
MNQQLIQIFSNPVFLLVFLIWSLFWKGFALWTAAGKKHLIWFVLILVINSLGLLEIAYIVYLNKWDIDNGKVLKMLEKFKKTK